MFFILFAILAASVVVARVAVDNPLDAQLPLIARVGQNYAWTFCQQTFSTDVDKYLAYSASGLPAWLSFDNLTLTFTGIPADIDQGHKLINVTAGDTESTASTTFFLYVTSSFPPTIQKTISQQFYAGNPALSSVIFLAPGSALAAVVPALRAPAGWSFSIGIDSDTCSVENGLFYGALQTDGTPLPPWMKFNASDVTFEGVAPSDLVVSTPLVVELELHCSDQEGYSADSLEFNLVVASHELSAYSTLPTVNVSAGMPFNVKMSSPADFTGMLVDGLPLQPANVSALSIEVSHYKDWLSYDPATKTLSGSPPSNFMTMDSGKPMLPVTLTSNFNQTLYTSVSLDIVPPFFSTSDLGTIQADPGQTLHFDLTKYFVNASTWQTNANLSVSFNPSNASAFLRFNPSTAQLAGQIPLHSDVPQLNVTFVAYSHVTHSTSHAALTVISPELEWAKGNSAQAKSEVTLIVSLVFGILGGALLVVFTMTLFKRFVRVKDAAAAGEQGTRAWADEEKQWRDIGFDLSQGSSHEHGYGWSNQADTSGISEKESLETQTKEGSSFDPGYYPHSQPYDDLGLRRVSARALATPAVEASCAEGVMKKFEFFGRIRNTVRNVSDKYAKRRNPTARPNISYPIPLTRRDGVTTGEPIEGQYVEVVKLSPPHLERAMSIRDSHLTGRRTSMMTSFAASSSNSIPRRRADFTPSSLLQCPRPLVPAVAKDVIGRRNLARESLQSASGFSVVSHPESLRPGEDRPHLQQFIHASRVPSPLSPCSNVVVRDATSSPEEGMTTGRVISQRAQVYKESQEGGQHTSVDELRIGMHYVRTLGEGPSNLSSVSEKSFSSLESSLRGGGVAGTKTGGASTRFLARTGEKFKFKVPIPHSSAQYRKLEARLVSGWPLPSFMQAELKGFGVNGGHAEEKKGVEFYGVPGDGDVGELHVGVFDAERGECLARVVLEVVERVYPRKIQPLVRAR